MNIEEIYNQYESQISNAIEELNEDGDYDEDGTIALVKINFDSPDYHGVLDYLELEEGMRTGDYNRDGGWRLVGFWQNYNEEEVLKLFNGVGDQVKIIPL